MQQPSLPYQRVVIIYNPQSTGDGPRLARELAEQLGERAPQLVVKLQETEAAGHAVELAKAAAQDESPALIVSASGDGGYHEVHHHPNCSWCGIYYVQIGQCAIQPLNGVNRFFPPVDIGYEDEGTMAFPQKPITIGSIRAPGKASAAVTAM